MVRVHYLLGETVELLGERKFGAQWLGGEIWASSIPSVEEARQKRAATEKELKDLEALCALLASAGRVEDTRGDLISPREREAIERRVQSLRNELGTAIQIDERHSAAYDCYQRRDAVLDVLLTALETAEIHSIALGARARTKIGEEELYTLGYTTIRDVDWAKRRALGMDKLASLFGLSILEPLDGDIFSRPLSIRILENEFVDWLDKNYPRETPLSVDEAEIQCRRWIKGVVDSGTKLNREPFVEQAHGKFSVLSDRAIRRIWDDKNGPIPDSWREAGRPKKGR
jgi:hypothetical protein